MQSKLRALPTVLCTGLPKENMLLSNEQDGITPSFSAAEGDEGGLNPKTGSQGFTIGKNPGSGNLGLLPTYLTGIC